MPLRNHRTRAHGGVRTNRYWCYQHGTGSDHCPVTNGRGMFLLTVEIRGDRTGPDRRTGTYLCIAKVGEVPGHRPRPQMTAIHFDKGANFYVCIEQRSRPNMGERPDVAARTNRRRTLHITERTNYRVYPNGHARVNERATWIHDRHSLLHPIQLNAPLHELVCNGKLIAAVHAVRFLLTQYLRRNYPFPLVFEHAGAIRQIELLLLVVRPNLLQRVEQVWSMKHIVAWVNLAKIGRAHV